MFSFKISSHPSLDLERPSLILTNSLNGKKFLFGSVPEGLQRSIIEHKQGLNKIDEIFFTGKMDLTSIGGLPGLILTSADQGRKALRLNYCGGHQHEKFFNYLVSVWRYFVFRFGLDLKVNEMKYGDTVDLSKEAGFKIEAFSFSTNQQQQVSVRTTTASSAAPNSKKINSLLAKIVDRVFPTSEANKRSEALNLISLPKDTAIESTSSCCYIIDFNPVRGKFLVEKAKALGVPPGPMFAKLTQNQSVTLEDGTIVTPDEVVDSPRVFGKVLILDIPDDHVADQILEKIDWNEEIRLVYHFIGVNCSTTKHQALVSKFPNAKHIISDGKTISEQINFDSSALLTLQLKSINNELFRRLPKHTPSGPIQDADTSGYYLASSDPIAIVKPNHQVEITVPTQDKSTEKDYYENLYETHIDPLALSFHTKEEILDENKAVIIQQGSSTTKDEVEVITLGTGSALPSNLRNVISTVVRIPSSSATTGKFFNSVILDAGENTIGSMKRIFTHDEFVNFFQNELSMIYLSHLHADHHLGIISLIKNFNNYNDQGRKLYLIAPWQFEKYLEESFMFNNDQRQLDNVVFLNCELFEHSKKKFMPYLQYEFNEENINNLDSLPKKFANKLSNDKIDTDVLRQFIEDCSILDLTTCKAIHCEWAYSTSICFKMKKSANKNGTDDETFRVSYSGDTRPALEFITIGQDSDLLIHEATLEDELIQDAIEKKHTTILEAKYVAALMNAKQLVLTHFSQRYARLPELSNAQQMDRTIRTCLKVDKFSIFQKSLDNATSGMLSDSDIIYAFDNMWFKLSQIHLQFATFSQMNVTDSIKLLLGGNTEEGEDGIDAELDQLVQQQVKKKKKKGKKETINGSNTISDDEMNSSKKKRKSN